MSKPSDGIWQCQADGNSFNGAGFSATLAGVIGVDVSQQATAALTVTDAACTGNTTVTTVTGGLLATHVGNALCLQGNGWFYITAVASSNSCTIDSNGPNSSGMTLRVGGAYLISANSLGFSPVAGNKVWIKAGAYSLSVNAVSTGVGSVLLPLVVEGYNTTRGDLTTTPTLTRPVLTRTASTIACVSINGVGQVWKHLELVGTGSSTGTLQFAASAFNCVGENFKITPDPAANGVEFLGRRNVLRHSYILPQAGAGNGVSLQGAENSLVEFCHIKGTTSHTGAGVENFSDGNMVRDCIIEKCGVGVLHNNTVLAHLWLENNRFYQNGTDLKITAAQQGAICVIPRWNIFSQATTFHANYTPADLSASTPVSEWMNQTWDCNWHYVTATRYHFLPTPSGDHTLTADPYTSPSTGDFSLNTTTGGGALVRAATCSVYYGDGVSGNTLTVTPGIGPQLSVSSDSSTTDARSIWREYTNERNTTVVPDATVDIYLNAGLQALNRRINYHLTDSTTDVVLVAGTQEYTLPTDCVQVAWVEWNGKELQKASTDEWRNRGIEWRTGKRGEPLEWAMVKNKLILLPTPDADAVATAPSPVFRYVSSPPSITTSGPEQLATQDHRVFVYWGVSDFSQAHPDSALAIARSEGFMAKFEHEADMIKAQYAARATLR